jgi:hypothetical protein
VRRRRFLGMLAALAAVVWASPAAAAPTRTYCAWTYGYPAEYGWRAAAKGNA